MHIRWLTSFLSLHFLISGFFVSHLSANPLDYRFKTAFKVESLSIQQGLSQSVVNDILQDSNGYIWLATEDGLNRFDGYEFKIFELQHNDPKSLHDNWIHSLAEQTGVGIWVGTESGLSLFDFSSQNFINYSASSDRLATRIRALQLSANDELYIASNNGLYHLPDKDGRAKLFKSAQGISIEDEMVDLDTGVDRIYAASAKCVYSIQQTSRQLTSYCDGELARLLDKRTIISIAVKKKQLWIGTNNGLIQLDTTNGQVRLIFLEKQDRNSHNENFAQSLAFDNEGNLWIGTLAGASMYRFSDSRFTHYKKQVYGGDGLSSDDVLAIMIDSSGLIWIGTYTGGVNILDPEQVGFKHIFSKADFAKFGINNTVYGIAKDRDENLWLASSGSGAVKLDMMTGELSRPLYNQISKQGKLNLDYVVSLMIDLHNRLWVASTDGIALFDLDKEKVIPIDVYYREEKINFSSWVNKIYEDHKAQVWLATEEGLYQVVKVKQKGERASVYIEKTHSLPLSYLDRSSRVDSLLETRDGNFWVGGQVGLAMYSNKNGKWYHFEYQVENPQSLSNNDVQVLFEDSRGTLWVGTASGLNRVNRSSDDEISFERITKQDGLPNNAIYGILEDNNNQLWLSTNRGVVRYSENTSQLQLYSQNDGLSSDEFNIAYYSDDAGLLYFGSINGVTIIDSNNIADVAEPPVLKFSEVKIGERELDVYALNQSKLPVVEKAQDEASVKVSVASLYYRKLQTASYRYRLFGLSPEWIYLDKERQLVLSGLYEGEYILEIQSRVAGSEWGSNGLKLRLFVQANFWKSKNAIYLALVVTIIVAILALFWLKKIYQNRLKNMQVQLKLEEIRLKDSKRSNEELKQSLDSKLDKIVNLKKLLSDSEFSLAIQEFRDPVSGFYRFENIQKILDRTDQSSSYLQNFNLVVLLKLIDFEQIKAEYGVVCSSEVCAYVAGELSKYTPASTHICSFSDNSFVFFADALNHPNLMNDLLSLQRSIELTQIPVANSVSAESRIGLSYIEVAGETVKDIPLLVKFARILIEIDAGFVNEQSRLLKVELNQTPEAFASIDLSPQVLIDNNKVTLHYL